MLYLPMFLLTRGFKKMFSDKVEFDNISQINPLDFEHQRNMDDWLILEKIEDVVVGSSKPYDYDNSRF